ncbi:MAG: hypothetical protein GY807_04845 [Gammaproteobacteria bacterium]|nr:hypothetical protein [Gammaproteobacteria bacterium]
MNSDDRGVEQGLDGQRERKGRGGKPGCLSRRQGGDPVGATNAREMEEHVTTVVTTMPIGQGRIGAYMVVGEMMSGAID